MAKVFIFKFKFLQDSWQLRTSFGLWLALLIFAAACTPAEVEPGFGRRAATRSAEISPTGSVLEVTRGSPNPFEPAPPDMTLTTTPWDPNAPVPTRTPIPPPPGLLFNTDEGAWQIGFDWQPVLISDRRINTLSPDGRQAVYQEGDDVWLLDMETGDRRNVTESSGRRYCCPQWWSAKPGILVMGSWPLESDLGPSTGFLTVVDINSGSTIVLDPETQSNALPGPSPDGQTIAYDRAGEAWLYHWDAGGEVLDLTPFALPEIAAIGGPAWSPDGRWLVWTVGLNNPSWQIALALIDMDEDTARLVHPYENIGRGGWFNPPSWSPDGRYIAFAAEDVNSERSGVWVVDTMGEGEFYLGPGADPLWSPDNPWLYFNSLEEVEGSLVQIPTLVEVGSWYPLRMGLPPGAQVLGWPPSN